MNRNAFKALEAEAEARYAIGDAILFLLNALFALVLATLCLRDGGRDALSYLWWALAFGALSLGALLGAICHALELFGKLPRPQPLKKGIIAVLGMAVFFLLMALAGYRFGSGFLADHYPIPLACTAAYLLLVLFRYRYSYLIVYSGACFLLSLACLATGFRWSAGELFIAAGLLVSLLSNAVQSTTLGLPPLDNNDLYHLIACAGSGLVFAGVLLLPLAA